MFLSQNDVERYHNAVFGGFGFMNAKLCHYLI